MNWKKYFRQGYINPGQEDKMQEFKNTKEELQQNMVLLVPNFDEYDQRIEAMEQEVIVIKAVLDTVKTDIDDIKKTKSRRETGKAENLNKEFARMKRGIREIRRRIQVPVQRNCFFRSNKGKKGRPGNIKPPTYDSSVLWTVYLKQFEAAMAANKS